MCTSYHVDGNQRLFEEASCLILTHTKCYHGNHGFRQNAPHTKDPESSKEKNMHSMYTSKTPQTLAGNLLYNFWNRNLEDK